MRARIKRISLFLAIFMLVVSMGGINPAAARASDYFAVTEAKATALGGGKVLIEFDVTSTDFMDELGALHIVIKEEQSSGTYKSVKTFSRYNTSGLIEKNEDCAAGSVTYYGTSGKKYYAIVAFYAADESGSEILNQGTNTVTA